MILQGKEFEPDLLLWDSEKHYEEFKGPWPSEEESILKGLVMGTRDYVVQVRVQERAYRSQRWH